MSELNNIALKIISSGKGILAADESTGTMTKRLKNVNVESNSENRLKFRHTLFSSQSMKTCIGGVILYDETIKQKYNSNKIPNIISETGAVPGIKVDTGAKVLANSKDEKITEGLDGLRDRLKEYYKLGARFAKWRAVITINNNNVSETCINSNSHSLARYAALCQEQNIVPIIEPEVLMEGIHTITTCAEITKRTLNKVFEELNQHKVDLQGIILKPNMIISALNCPEQADINTVSDLTYKTLKEYVPENVPGIAFLSGGQESKLATAHLNEMNRKFKNKPWNLTFSYGRALQHNCLIAWKGENRENGQKELLLRAKMNHLASIGKCKE